MEIVFDGRSYYLNGRTYHGKGQIPKKPMRWSGKFLVVDAVGTALEAEWKVNGGPPMTYQRAKEMGHSLIDKLRDELAATGVMPIKKVAFTLRCR